MTITKEDLDARNYLQWPRSDAAGTAALGLKLIRAAPRRPTAAVKEALGHVKGSCGELETAWASRGQVEGESIRPIVTATTVGWSMLHDRIVPFTRLTEAPAAATNLITRLFPDKLLFTRSDADTLYMESRKRIQMIDDEHLTDDLHRYAGPEFLTEVVRAQAALGEAIGATGTPDAITGEAPDLAELSRQVVKAISNYALQLAAWHNASDDEVRTMARAALRPIDDARAASPRRAATSPTPANGIDPCAVEITAPEASLTTH